MFAVALGGLIQETYNDFVSVVKPLQSVVMTEAKATMCACTQQRLPPKATIRKGFNFDWISADRHKRMQKVSETIRRSSPK